MLRWRLLSATVIVAVLMALVWLDYNNVVFGAAGVWLIPIGVFFSVAGAAEMLTLYRAQNLQPAAWSVYCGAVTVFLATCVPILWDIQGKPYPTDCPLGKFGWTMAALALCIGLAFIGEMLRYQRPGGIIINVALSIFATAYLGLPLAFTVRLRLLHDNAWGILALISLIIVVKFSDIGAYAVGRLFGKHKMTPRLSPGKTIEGAIGGVIAACLASWFTFQVLGPRLIDNADSTASWWGILIFGIVIALAGMLGDLAESLIKRDMNCKDSSHLLPGLGGVLDVLDSVLSAAPVAYVCWAVGLVGPTAS